MAKLYFGANDKSLVVSNSNTEVIGLSGTGVESVTIAQGVSNVTLRQNIEQLVLNGASSSYKFQQAGGTLKIYDTAGTLLIATVPVQGDADGTLITFTDGTASAMLTSGVMKLGGATVSATAAAVTPTLTGATTPITFSLDKDSYDVVEGNTLKFTVTASAAVQTATTVRYTIAGDDLGGIATKATQGTDFSPASATVTFASGETSKEISITVPNDGVTEGLEGAKLRLLSSSFSELDNALIALEDGADLPVTRSLSKDTDTLQGGTQNDTFLGSIALSSGALNITDTTLTSTDTINAGDGTDVLRFGIRGTLSTGLFENIAPQLNSVETVLLSDDTTAGTGGVNIVLTNATSVTTVGTDSVYGNANAAIGFIRSSRLLDVSMRGPDSVTVGFQPAVREGTNTLNLNLQGAGTSATDTADFAIGAGGGIENISITSSTNSNYLSLTDGELSRGSMATLQKVTVAGSSDLYLDLNNTSGTGVITVEASTFSGALTVDGINSGAVTLTGGNGNDTFDFRNSNDSGSTFDAGTGTSKDSLVGGSGVDTLIIGSGSTLSDTQLKNVSSVEVLYLNGSSATGALSSNALAAGITTVNEATGDASTINLTVSSGYTSSLTVNLNGTGDTVNATGATGGLTVNVNGTGWTNDTLSAGTGTSDTLSIKASDATGTLSSHVTGFEKITVTADGSKDLNLTTDEANVASGATLTVDASALTSSDAVLTFAGSGETDGKFSILGGAGADTITAGAGNDTVSGGAGNDSIIGSGGGNDSILGGDGDDTINMGTALSSGDTLVGGSGNDTLIVTSDTITSAIFTNVSEIETLKLSASTVGLSSNISFTTFDLTDSTGTALTLSTTGYTNATTVNMGSGDSVTNSANVALTVNISEADASGTGGTLLVTGGTGTGDTVNITVGSGSGDITLASTAKVDVINVLDNTGAANYDISIVATGYATALKVDATELDAGTVSTGTADLDEQFTFNGAGASGKLTLLGGGGADYITAGNGDDKISGGIGNDTIIAGNGADSIDAGAGNDTVYFGTGTSNTDTTLTSDDTVVGGDGTDTLWFQQTGALSDTDARFQRVTGFETLVLGSGTTGEVFVGTNAKNVGFTTIKLSDASTSYIVTAQSAYQTTAITFDLNGNTGSSKLTGNGGDDTFIVTGTGVLGTADSLIGGAGNDTIRLDNGTGDGSAVSIVLGSGTSSIEAIVVNDQSASTGVSGDVTINLNSGYASTGTLVIDASSLDYVSASGDESLTLAATGFSAAALSVVGGAGNDTIAAGGGNDTLTGGGGNDSITGGAGNDSLDGGDGADSITGGTGGDTLTGGAGNDKFYFANGDSNRLPTDTTDTLTDFAAGDQLVFSGVSRTFNATTSGVVDLTQAQTQYQGSFADFGTLGNIATGQNGAYAYIINSKQLVMDMDGNGLFETAIVLSNSTGIDASALTFSGTETLNVSAGIVVTASGNEPEYNILNFLSSGGSTATITNFDSVSGSTGSDTVTVASGSTFSGAVSDAGGGITFSAGSNYSGDDSVTFASSGQTGLVFSLGSGADTLTFSGGGNTATFSGGTETDTLVLSGTGNTITIVGVETVTGSTGDDFLTISTSGTSGISLGSGNDTLTLSVGITFTATGDVGGSGNDTLAFAGTGGVTATIYSSASFENVSGSTGSDTLVLGDASTLNIGDLGNGLLTVSGSTGADTLTYTSSGATGGLVFNLGAGSNNLTVSGNSNTGTFDGGAGEDILVLTGTGNVFTIQDVETVTGSTGSDTVTVASGSTFSGAVNDTGGGITFSAGASFSGNDYVTFTSSSATGLVFSLGSGADTLTFSGGGNTATFSGGTETDTLVLTGTGNTVTISEVETVSGSTGNDFLTISTSATGGISLGSGDDTLTLSEGITFIATGDVGGSGDDTLAFAGSGGATATIYNEASFASVSGSTGSDTLVLADAIIGIDIRDQGNGLLTVSGSTGNDVLYYFSSGATGGLVFNLGSGDDSLTLQGNSNTGSFDGGSGSDTLIFPNGTGNVFTIQNVESVGVATGFNTVTVASGSTFSGAVNDVGGSITFSAGSNYSGDDNVTFASSGQTGLVFSLGSGDDILTISGGGNTGRFTGGDGIDTLVLTGTGNTVTINSVETITGSTGVDTVIFGSTGNVTVGVFGATGAGYNFDDAFGTSGAAGSGDVIDPHGGGAVTIVFGTGALGSGNDFGLRIINTDDAVMLNFDQMLTGTQFFGSNDLGGSTGWLDLNSSGYDGFSGLGEGVIFVYSTGGVNGTFDSGDVNATGSGSNQLTLATGDTDVVVIVATGSGDTSVDLYVINAHYDNNDATISDTDIKLIGTVSFLTGFWTVNFDSSNVLLS